MMDVPWRRSFLFRAYSEQRSSEFAEVERETGLWRNHEGCNEIVKLNPKPKILNPEP